MAKHDVKSTSADSPTENTPSHRSEFSDCV